ncbi:peptidoglycan DD-metalloendopeptidase family protein [Paraglaciecola chathamensis]|uniref:Family M23 zinc metallopeptidase with OapA domain protein n=3 Tax=Paraglaciecola chathamensis TaxID=368405 RepID=A0A8H9IDL4_9ALTE|nr:MULTISPECIES: peptidoglycan DD-metalloendopeptidase family protein [Paraglaciecola]MBU3018902.1 peptidoglycan DD-metalloendopeptidase family protein [Paraglaciecola agarilytica]GAC04891.1 peptidase, M23/M37 family protein [Paraglaciecola agarilytica NO2]GAC11461.1 peptidase, M23/M37 family protein [Paraglaciecola chathamensis S18K6]GGZ52524.1 family M23 zinc metallopeptidase with OapA domain protein [Paraglaciecola oceanifecundans]
MVQKAFSQLPKAHKWAVISLASIVLILALFPSDRASASRNTEAALLEIGKRYELPISTEHLSTDNQSELSDELEWKTFQVKRGDTLAKIFARAGLSARDTYNVSSAGDLAKKLLKIRPGQLVSLQLDEHGEFAGLEYAYSNTETLLIKPNEAGKLVSSVDKKTVDTRLNYAQGEINSSFWNAGVKAHLSESQIMSLAAIFGWDIDFALEIRQGDNFNVVFEEKYIDGEFVEYGDIVSAEFTNGGNTFTAIRYSDGNYYTPEGRSMRKSFLRAPVSFKYISSSFTKRRFHPVQKRWKAHRGVDYAANRGTPVMAAGDGKVIRSSYDKYNGNHVFIQHGEKYVTKYLHFTKRKVKVGQTVKQGDIIGTVGSTGLASGPHLHYEFLVDGVHRNPRTVSLPKALPIDKKERSAFELVAKEQLELLSNSKRIMLAMN